MKIPDETDWRNDHGDLDIDSARKNFFGLRLDEAENRFRQNALSYQEDVIFMPPACFAYYLHAYLNYLLSSDSRGDSDGASCFFGLVECRSQDLARLPAETRAKVSLVLEKLGTGQDYFDADESIYGSFATKADVARKQLDEAQNQPRK